MPYATRVTKNFQTIYGAADNTVPIFLEGDFTNWVAANSNNLYNIGGNYIVKDAVVTDVLRGVNGFNVLEHSGSVNVGKTLNDMGKDIRVSSNTGSEYVVFRLIQIPGLIVNQGASGATGYIVVDNNCSDLTRPRFQVCVARV
jgi:hypothetical protein